MSRHPRFPVAPLATAAVFGMGLLSPSAGKPEFIVLGDPATPGATTMMLALNISHDGRCVVGEAPPVDGAHGEGLFATRGPRGEWIIKAIGTFETTDSHYSPAYDVVAKDLTIVGFGSSGTPPVDMPYEFAPPGPMSPLGLFPADLLGEARGINKDGTVIVGWGSTHRSSRFGTGDAHRHALQWTTGGGTPALIDAAPDAPVETVAMAVSGTGNVIAGFAVSEASQGVPYDPSRDGRGHQGIVWRQEAGGYNRSWLPFLTTVPSCARAHDIDEEGERMVGFSGTLGDSKPILWVFEASSGTFQLNDLGTLPGYEAGGANGISPDGRVVVGSCYNSDGADFESTAFVWDAKDGMRGIREVLLAAKVEQVADWQLIDATGVSRQGHWICGHATNANGDLVGWVARMP